MDPGAASSRRVRQLIESAGIIALLPEGAINEAKSILTEISPGDVPGWRVTFMSLDGGSRANRASGRITIVEAFELLCHKGGDPVPPGIVFLDELARQIEGPIAFELERWVDTQAKHLGVVDAILGLRPSVPSFGEGDSSNRKNGNLSDDPVRETAVLDGTEIIEKLLSPELTEGGETPKGDQMPPAQAVTQAKEKLPLVWGGVPPINPHFTGRETLLHYLHAKLQNEREAAVLPQALHGMGGVGKSQIAIEYVHRHRSDYELIWWIPAERKADILASLTELAFQLKLDLTRQANNAVPALLHALNTDQIEYENWLLIFDNAEDVAEARAYFPTGGHGTILVTSRNLEWARASGEVIEVDVFTPEESRRFLLTRSPDLSPADADRLSEELGYLPLAVEQASSWHAVTGMPVNEYLELLEAKRIELLSQTPSQDGGSVAAAWNVSLDRLERDNPAALQLLQVCSFFAPFDISRDLFVAAPVRITDELDDLLGDPIKLSRAIRDIQKYALARLNHQDSTLQIHRLIQAVLVSRLDTDQAEVIRRGAHALLVNANPKHPHRPDKWQQYQMLYKHFEASRVTDYSDTLIRTLVINMVEFLFYWGAHAECRQVATRAHKKWTDQLGFDNPYNLKLAIWLGYMLWVVGEFGQAAALNRQIFAAYERTVGPDDEGTLDAGRAICIDLRSAGDFAAAKERIAGIYEKARRLFGADDPFTLKAAHEYGVSLRLAGEYTAAIELDTETVQRRSDVLGPDHQETMRTLDGLAIDRREAGEFVEAHRLQEQIYRRHLETMGPDNPMSLQAARNLAVARRKAGDHSGAKELAEVTAEKFRRRYGDGYPDTMAAALNYAVDLRQVGQLNDARDLGSALLERYRRVLGDRHPHSLSAQTNLAIVLRLLNDPQGAQALNKAAHEALVDEIGADHPVTLTCATNLASDLYALGEAQAAYELDSDTLERSQHVLGSEHPSVLACSANLALDLRRLDRKAEAEKIQGNTMALFRKVLGDRHPATLNALQSIRADCDVDPMPL